MEKQAIQNILLDGEMPSSNAARLRRWRARYRMSTGLRPVDLYQVGFCRTCNKPHWLINSKQRHLVTYCPGH